MVTSAVRAPRRSSSALVATVMPCANAADVARVDGLERAHHALGLILGRARHLGRPHADTIERHQVGERAPDIDADADHARPL